MAIALAMTVVSVIGSAGAQWPVEPSQVIAQEVLVNRYASAVSEMDFRLGDHQQLRKLLLGN
jgi:hypothetical protein